MRLDISDDGRATLDTITAGVTEVPPGRRRRRPRTTRRAWSMVAKLEAEGHGPERLAVLESASLIERWERKDGQAVTLTPWGKFVQEVELLERPTVVREEDTERDKDGHRVKVTVEREDVEVYWGREDPTRPRPARLAYRRREFRMPYPELLPDPGPGPEYLLDDDGDPVELFKGLFNGLAVPGVKVEIDARLTGAKTKKGKDLEPAPECTVNLHDRPTRGFSPEELGLRPREQSKTG